MWEKGILGREGGREKERVGERDKNHNALDLTLTVFSENTDRSSSYFFLGTREKVLSDGERDEGRGNKVGRKE